jgi:hypothetical protein
MNQVQPLTNCCRHFLNLIKKSGCIELKSQNNHMDNENYEAAEDGWHSSSTNPESREEAAWREVERDWVNLTSLLVADAVVVARRALGLDRRARCLPSLLHHAWRSPALAIAVHQSRPHDARFHMGLFLV